MIETKNQTNGTSRADRSDKTLILVTTAMMTAMVMIATTFFKIPNAMGYIHLGDGFVLLAAIILPKKYACFAGGVGAGLADIYGGYAVWAPWTLVMKIIMVLIVQLFFDLLIKRATNGGHVAKVEDYLLRSSSHTYSQFSGLYLVTTQRKDSYMETGLLHSPMFPAMSYRQLLVQLLLS